MLLPSKAGSFSAGQTCQDTLTDSTFSPFHLPAGAILRLWAFSQPPNALLHLDLALLELVSSMS